MTIDLRPLSLGEILDRSVSTWRAHWLALFKIFLGLQLGTWVLMKAWELISSRYFPAARGGQRMVEMMQSDPMEAVKQMGGSWSVFAALMLFAMFGSYFCAIAATHYVYPRMIGQTSSVRGALTLASGQLTSIAGFCALFIAWVVGVGLLLVAPGSALVALSTRGEPGPAKVTLAVVGVLLALAGSVVLVLWLILRFMLGAQVLALEPGGAMHAFRRSNALSSGRVEPGFMGLTKIRLTIVFTVIALILLTVSGVFAIPQMALIFIYTNPMDPVHSNPDAIPLLFKVPAELIPVVVQAVLSPIMIVFNLVFYMDVRVRREGLDLELKLKAAQP